MGFGRVACRGLDVVADLLDLSCGDLVLDRVHESRCRYREVLGVHLVLLGVHASASQEQ